MWDFLSEICNADNLHKCISIKVDHNSKVWPFDRHPISLSRNL